MVSRATLHNQEEIERKDIREGDTVIIQRAGDVIPEVVKVITSKRTGKEKLFKMPDKCPVCGSELIERAGDVVLRCSNPDCPAQVKGLIKHFVSKDAMDIDGLGEKIIHQLLDKGLIKDTADLYDLNLEDLLHLDKMAEKLGTNILNAINASKNTTLSRFIYSLGIRHVGEHTAHVLAEKYKDLGKLAHASREDLLSVNEIGPEIADSIISYFSNEENITRIKRLFEAGIKISEMPSRSEEVKEHIFSGKSFVLTGKLTSLSRQKAKKLIEERKGRVSNSISSKTDYLILGESPGSKLSKAKELGITILHEKEFLDILNKES
jgi:DNA ligase (NAD+)